MTQSDVSRAAPARAPAAGSAAAPPTAGAESASKCGDDSGSLLDVQAVRDRRNALERAQADECVAVALSGGGIRSATFSLGVMQAIAAAPVDSTKPRDFRNSMLSTIDYLSTVSGGGYLGGFLCSLFLPGRLRGELRDADKHRPWWKHLWERVSGLLHPAADGTSATVERPSPALPAAHAKTPEAFEAAENAVRILSSGPPGRMRADDEYTRDDDIMRTPLRWLRENGRYLLPTGSGDAVYAMALGLRNWVSVHCVIGTVLVCGLAFVMLLRAWAAMEPTYLEWEKALLQAACKAYQTPGIGIDRIWWSTLTMLCLVPVASIGLVLGTAFWLVQEQPDGRSRPINESVAGMTLVGVALVTVAAVQWPDHFGTLRSGDVFWLLNHPQRGEVVRMGVVVAVGAVALLSVPVYMILSGLFTPSASRQRVALTRGLAWMLGASAVIAGLGIVDTVGQSLYLAAFYADSPGGKAATVASPAALAGALVWLVQRLAKSDGGKLPDFVRKLPLMSLAGLAGLVIFVLVGALWAMLVHLMIWGGGTPSPGRLFAGSQAAILGWLVGATLAVALVTGFFPGFINLSSLQPFYGSRLTRAYLGASNGRRFLEPDSVKRSAAEPMTGDEVRLSDYFNPETRTILTLAPLHIINVCVNKTVDPAEQLVQRDRKGLPLAVLPCGLALDQPAVGSWTLRARPKWPQTSVDRPLSVGQWIGTSGAAFSTGIGRETTLGMSLLMGAANVRLGTWWSTGRGKTGTPRTRVGRAMPPWLRELAGLPFRTQRYLSYELRASFHGTNRSWQYLSDGGHFENTALYELLRPHRRVGTIFASDNGADPEYRFDDLANLIRLARIDLQVRVVVADPPTSGPLAGLFGRPEDLRAIAIRRADSPAAPGATPTPAQSSSQGPTSPIAVLLYAWQDTKETTAGPGQAGQQTPPTQIVLIKPLVTADAPMDVRQYAATHPSFPQEPTADQFFDEAQWESYRALGEHQARRLCRHDVVRALEAARQDWKMPSVPLSTGVPQSDVCPQSSAEP